MKLTPTYDYDRYLSDKYAFNRLLKEYKKYGQIIVAYDFDGTVHDFHKEGLGFRIVPQLLRECKELGIAKFIVFTAREEKDYGYIRDYLNKMDIPFDTINENILDLEKQGNKLYYNILLDDRAGLKSAYDVLLGVMSCVKYHRPH